MTNLNRFFSCITLQLFSITIYAQVVDSAKNSINTLDSITIQAYNTGSIMRTAAAVNQIIGHQFNRYGNVNVLAAINATPGVRMEERSLGSYRLNIRGSSVRSPYGVRNVKLYYENIPFTAPGGNSMLNMLGFNNIGDMAIIKGAGGSLYGAGTGGVMLINSPKTNNLASLGFNVGSYGAHGITGAINFNHQMLTFEQQEAKGYRDHTQMKRQTIAYHSQILKSNVNSLKLHFLHSNLYYQTPGALTLSEYQTNPSAARPAAGPNPGASEAQASITQDATLLGLNNHYVFNNDWQNTTTLYGFLNETENPAIQNFEDKKEPHWGGRTSFNFTKGDVSFQFGGEYQQGSFSYKTYQNLAGTRGAIRTVDELKVVQLMGFLQVNWQIKRWLLTAAASANNLDLDFQRTNLSPPIIANKNYAAEIQPRFAALYQLNPQFSLYLNIVKGFSPPASSEIFADNNSLNLALQPEKGWALEPGFRGNLTRRVLIDVAYFRTKLSNAIVTRRDAAGANYFLNAGKIKQEGLETAMSYQLLTNDRPIALTVSASHTWHRFKYAEFVQMSQDFSGNNLPGVPPHNYTIMADIKHKTGAFVYLNYSHTDKIPLNDANAQLAKSYQLLGAKVGTEKALKRMSINVYLGAENLLNQTYSLGNDVNGFGGRYYNVAPERSFYLGLKFSLAPNNSKKFF